MKLRGLYEHVHFKNILILIEEEPKILENIWILNPNFLEFFFTKWYFIDKKSSKNVKVDLMVDSLIIHTTIASTSYLHQKAQSPRQITGDIIIIIIIRYYVYI